MFGKQSLETLGVVAGVSKVATPEVTDRQVQLGSGPTRGPHRAHLSVATEKAGYEIRSHKSCSADREHLF